MPENFTLAIAGAHHDTASADAVRQLRVAMAVADNERARQVDAVFRGGLIQHAGARFSARASVARDVGTIIDAIQVRPGFSQLLGHQIVDGVHQRFGVVSTSDSGLVGDHKDKNAALVQFADGSRRKRKHTKTRNVIQVADFVGNGAVTIKKNGGF
ncbi:MAG: hypothetical protein QOJ41_834 [Acidobacteriaceae bacterium]|nr:hypothetical protein [Acidobacteriaceae bacterium]